MKSVLGIARTLVLGITVVVIIFSDVLLMSLKFNVGITRFNGVFEYHLALLHTDVFFLRWTSLLYQIKH